MTNINILIDAKYKLTGANNLQLINKPVEKIHIGRRTMEKNVIWMTSAMTCRYIKHFFTNVFTCCLYCIELYTLDVVMLCPVQTDTVYYHSVFAMTEKIITFFDEKIFVLKGDHFVNIGDLVKAFKIKL